MEIQVHCERDMKNLIAMKVAFAATAKIQGHPYALGKVSRQRDQGHEACVAEYTQDFLNAEVREG